ncbi:MAG: phosphopantothenoylcysteine decarboxylase [Candidatus Latescibacter sp.]|nr:phosphopantothenoylcysteine decarboxylase [Candidatus Latescibacter sp.]
MNEKSPGKVLVTSGPTRAWLDRVRYIANTSTGALGARVAEALVSRGIRVKLIRGLGGESPSVSVSSLLEEVEVVTIDDLIEQIRITAASGNIRAVVHAMAVLDYVPECKMGGKQPSSTEFWDVRLVRAPKVIALIRELLPDACTVGFKLEAGVSEEELAARAGDSLRRYNLDMVVANDLDRVAPDAHEAIFVAPGGTIIDRASSKKEIAAKIAEFIVSRMS